MANRLKPTLQGCLFALGFLGMTQSPSRLQQEHKQYWTCTLSQHICPLGDSEWPVGRHKHVINLACFGNALESILLFLPILPPPPPPPSLFPPLPCNPLQRLPLVNMKWYFMRDTGIPCNLLGCDAARSQQNYFAWGFLVQLLQTEMGVPKMSMGWQQENTQRVFSLFWVRCSLSRCSSTCCSA